MTDITHIKTIAVIGSGQMGAGIAQVAAQSGFSVRLYDLQSAAVERAQAGMARSLAKLESKGRLAEGDDAAAVLARVQFTTEFNALADADFAVEAIVE